MRYHALATDYDGTLAHDGHVDEPTVAALERLLATGRKLVLVTGRELDELLGIFPEIHLFEQVVAENGALLYTPATREEKALAEAAAAGIRRPAAQLGVGPISVGRVIVATWTPYRNRLSCGPSAKWVWNCKSSSTRGQLWCCPQGSTRQAG